MSTTIHPSALLRPRPKQVSRGTYYIQTWGCQMNEEDSEQIALGLSQIGFEPAEEPGAAHVILLNTCSVRKKPEDKAFSMLGELAIAKKQRPELVVGVCGCMAQLRASEIKRRAPHVDFVVGTAHISEIPGLVEEALQKRKFASRLELPERKGAVVSDVPERLVGRQPKLKAFVPIQYGCDKFCTFCIVPTTRGRERSRPTQEILHEVAELCEAGTREVTLLGQTVNSYGKNLEEGKVPFGQLLNKLSEVEDLWRIRYTSPYPRDFKSDLIDVIRDNPKVMEHVHMPLQAGDNEMLKSMKRLYTRESFGEIVEELRAKIPQILITTDLIVGFPGETEEQFLATLSAVEEFNFYGSYMFIYSPRPGTPASSMEQLPYELKHRRLKQLMDLQKAQSLRMNQQMIGREVEVLVESRSRKDPSKLQGYSREWVMTHFEGPDNLIGQRVKAELTKGQLWGCQAQLID